MDTRGLLATLEAVMWEVGALPSQETRGELGFTRQPPFTRGQCLLRVTQVEKVHWGAERLQGRQVELSPCTPGTEEARNGTVPPGVACQAGRGRGTVAGDAGGTVRERETGLQKLFPSLEKQFSKGFKFWMNL